MRYDLIDRGRGRPAVFLHGLGSDRSGLRELAEALPSYDAVLPDLPGYGQSPPLAEAHTLANYAHELERLRIELGYAAGFDVIGHSLGASIALVYGSLYPAGARSLVLLNPVTTSPRATALVAKLYFRIGAALPEPAGRLWMASRPAVWVNDAFVIRTKDRERRRAILEQDYRTYRLASLRAMSDAFHSLLDTPFADHAVAVGAVGVPTTVLTGARDSLSPPSAAARLAELIGSSCRLGVIPDAGHLWPAEEPDAAAARIRLGDVSDAPRPGVPLPGQHLV